MTATLVALWSREILLEYGTGARARNVAALRAYDTARSKLGFDRMRSVEVAREFARDMQAEQSLTSTQEAMS